jgi:hypothetical protein
MTRASVTLTSKRIRYGKLKAAPTRIEIGASSTDIRLTSEIEPEKGSECPFALRYLCNSALYEWKGSANRRRRICGHPRPSSSQRPAGLRSKKNRIIVNDWTAVCDLKYAPGWFGRFFERAIRHIVHFLRHIGHRADANTLVMGIYENPIAEYVADVRRGNLLETTRWLNR